MQQALENIRNRVDAFGVGEPDIAVSGTTIEVQIPGSADATIRRRDADLSCLEGGGKLHGCSENEDDVHDVLDSLEVRSQPSEVCVLDGDGEQVECFSSRAQAQTFLEGIEVVPKEAASPSATASPSAQPTGSPSPEGPAPAASGYCLNSADGERIQCFDRRAEAQDAKDAMEVRVTDRSYCIVPVAPEPSPTPSPPPSSPSGTPTPSASASPSPSPSPATFNDLDLSGADPLPCEIGSEEEADAALAAITITPETQRFCVISSGGEELGCSVQRSKAEELRRQSGQERLLRVIGETARLEERRVREIVPANDPRPITCAAEEEQDLPRCTDAALQDDEVVFAGPSPAGQGVAKFVLGPVVISGDNFDSARAVLSQSGQLGAVSEWTVTFQLDSEGTDAFATATTEAVGAPPPTDQIAIIVDRVVISSPTVQSAITGGSGEITGGFSEQEARGPRHPAERRRLARGAHAAVGAYGEPDAG